MVGWEEGVQCCLGTASLAANLVPAKPAVKTEQRPTKTRISRKWCKNQNEKLSNIEIF